MRVLDAGCGVGDTTFLAADIIGPEGCVVGLDRSADAIATARTRAQADGRNNVQFLEGELGLTIPGQEPFDAVVGRLILVHQPDVVEALRKLGALVRPGGVMAFHEVELTLRGVSDPSSHLAKRVAEWICRASQVGGIQLNAVSQMPRYFFEAGFGWPETMLQTLASCGAESFGAAYAVRTLRPLLPLLERAGVITADELDIDTLEARLRDSCANGAPSVVLINGGAWAHRR